MTQISEVVRYDPEDKQIVILDIFNFRNGVSLRPTGYMPSFIDSLVEKDLLDVEFLYGRDGQDHGRSPILIPLGCLLMGAAVGTLAWSAQRDFSRWLDYRGARPGRQAPPLARRRRTTCTAMSSSG